MFYKLSNIHVISKSTKIDLAVVGLNTLLVLSQILTTSKMFKRTSIKNQTMLFSNMLTRSTKRCISFFMSSVRMSTSKFIYQKETVLT